MSQSQPFTFGSYGETDAALAVESEPVVVAARQLDELGLDALQKASLFGNVTAMFAMKSGLSRAKYLKLMSLLWEATQTQMALIDSPPLSKGGVA
jgi:hypothetical protein